MNEKHIRMQKRLLSLTLQGEFKSQDHYIAHVGGPFPFQVQLGRAYYNDLNSNWIIMKKLGTSTNIRAPHI